MAKEVWLLISIAVIVVLLGIIALIMVLKGKKKRKTDYCTLFLMGIIWLPCGIAINSYALSAIGFIFIILGLVHKKEWKKNYVPWKKLSETEKILKISVIIVLLIVLIAGITLYFLADKGII